MKTITIIGGGLAGLTLGLELRKRGVPVRLLEAGSFPRHRVCGEFINGRGLPIARQLGLENLLEKEGQKAEHAAFFPGARRCIEHRLPTDALSISRFVLDDALAQKFRDAGGNLECGVRWAGEVREGIVLASGRQRHTHDRGTRWFGIKAHARDVALKADLEMHLHRNFYVGLCRLAAGAVNVCGLFRVAGSVEAQSADALTRLCGPAGSVLNERLRSARFDLSSVCSVAGFSFQPIPSGADECRVGDALTMIPPVTGNGMSIAFESAALAVQPLTEFAAGRRTWGETTEQIGTALRTQLASRLRWAGHLHQLMFGRWADIGWTFARWNPVWRACFSLTR